MKLVIRLVLFFVLHLSYAFSQIPSYVPTDSLIGWWPFNGNANDESGYGNNGVNYGANLTSDRFGNSNSAYIFNGLSNYIEVASSSSLSLSNAFTVSVWVQVSSYASGGFPYQPAIVSKISNEDWYGGYEIRAMNDINGAGSTLGTSGRIGGNFINLNKPNNPTNEWLNLLVTYNGFKIKLYINGTIVDSSDVNGELETSDLPLRFGRRGGAGDNNCWFNGKIDDVGIWRRSLSNQEITQIYQSNNTNPIIPIYVPQNGLIGWWPFNGNANDQSGNGKNGIVYGAKNCKDRKGNVNSAYLFNGFDNSIYLGNWFNYFEFSISIWIKPSTQSAYATVIDNNHTHMTNWVFHTLTDDYYYSWSDNPIFLKSNEWHHLVFTYKDTVGYLYHNGILEAELKSYKINYSRPPALSLGSSVEYGRFWKGEMDDLCIWNRKLNSYEISSMYKANASLEPNVLTISNVSCFGGNDGIAKVTNEGGIGPYTYSWNTNPVQTTQTATNLSAGSYTVTVKDSRDSIATASITITQPPAITNVTASVIKNVDCFGEADGSASVSNPTGGTPPYSYSWNTIPAQLTQNATNMKAGDYTVTITDSKGCIAHAAVTITQPNSPVEIGQAIVEKDVSCYGLADGIVRVPSPSGGTPPYTVVWNTQPVNYSERVEGVKAGTYTAVVIDSKGCIAEASTKVNQPPKVDFISPKDTVVLIQTNARLYAKSSNESSTYQWQTNLGTGFQDIQEVYQYTGTRTPNLNISNCSFFNDKQPFRCLIMTNGCEDTTQSAILSIRTNVSVEDVFDNTRLSISPNPIGGADQFIVRFAEIPNQDISMELLDILGSIHYSNTIQAGSESFTIPVQGLSSGMYMLRVRMNNELFIEKVIVN